MLLSLQIAETVLQLSSSMLEELMSDVAMCRAVAELMAAAACIASDNLAIKQVCSTTSNPCMS